MKGTAQKKKASSAKEANKIKSQTQFITDSVKVEILANQPKKKYINRSMKNVRTKGKKPCKCLSCDQKHIETFQELTILVCGDEACFMECDRCTDRPSNCCMYHKIQEIV